MITLIIPTLNRSDFVIRYIRYLNEVHFRGCVCIGDSSDSWHVERTKCAIQELNADYEIVYRELPGLGLYECLLELVPLISTPYAMFICDDDLLVPKTLERCIEFLECNPEYSGVTGVATVLSLRSPDGSVEITRASQYPLRSIEDDTAAQRLTNLLGDYNVLNYSVNRTEQLRQRWIAQPGLSDTTFGAEVFPTCLLIIQGKVKQLEHLFVGRQIHLQRYILARSFDWMTRDAWLPSYRVFEERLASALADQDGITMDQGRSVAKKAFLSYLIMSFTQQRQRLYGPSGGGDTDRPDTASPTFVHQFRQTVRRIPGARRGWHVLSSMRQAFGNGGVGVDPFSLNALLDPSSPYQEDFLPIYRAVTSEPPPERSTK